MSGSIYAYEYVKTGEVFPSSGSIYAYEYPTNRPDKLNGSIYAYEYSVPNTNPAKIRVYDGTQWVTRPDYIWNGTAWTAIT